MRMCTVIEKYYLNISTKTYIVGTQKNGFNETVLLSTQNMLKLMGRKIISILQSLVLRNWAYVYSFFPKKTHWKYLVQSSMSMF